MDERVRGWSVVLSVVLIVLLVSACDGGGSNGEEGPRGSARFALLAGGEELLGRTADAFYTRYENPVTGVEGFALVIATEAQDTLYLYAPRAKPGEGVYPVVPLELERETNAFMAVGTVISGEAVQVRSGTGQLVVTESHSDSLFGAFSTSLHVETLPEDSLWQVEGQFRAAGSDETAELPLHEE